MRLNNALRLQMALSLDQKTSRPSRNWLKTIQADHGLYIFKPNIPSTSKAVTAQLLSEVLHRILP